MKSTNSLNESEELVMKHSIWLCFLMLLSNQLQIAVLGCCSLAPAHFSSTRGYAGEARKDGKLVHLLAYQNVAQNLAKAGGNAMLLPIPSKPRTMTRANVLDTSKAAQILADMEIAITPVARGPRPTPSPMGVTPKGPPPVQIFDSDIYTIVLAQNAADIPGALNQVKPEKRPKLNHQIFDAYAKWYPGWTFALCCFNNKDASRAKPMLWWYEPQDQSRLFFPAVDEHDGVVPDLKAQVGVDHVVTFSSIAMPGGATVSYRDRLAPQLKQLLPKKVLGAKYYGTMPNGDFSVALASLNSGKCPVERVLPPGVQTKPLGQALQLLRAGEWPSAPASVSALSRTAPR